MQEQMITPIKVIVKLKDSQALGFNKWKVSIHGEDRIVPTQYTQWFCMSIEDAIISFKPSQVQTFEIHGNYNTPLNF